jgi:acyl dehydratase
MKTSTKQLIAIVLSAVMMSSALGVVGAQETRQQVETPIDAGATVAFSDQTTDGTSVTVDSVNVSDGGFVVIHDDSLLDGDVTGSVIGVSEYLEPGENENVTVTLFDGVPGATFNRTELSGNETLIAMPHRDTNANETYDFVATNGSADGPYAANGTAVTSTANVTVEAAEPPETTGESFVVTSLTAPEIVVRGDTLSVTATIENPNDEADTQTVDYRFNGNVSGRDRISLNAGESTNITPTVDTSIIASGNYVHGVYTRSAGQPAQVRVVDEIVPFGVTGLTAPESVTAGDNVTVNATVSNPNDFPLERSIQFRFDGDLVETQNVDLDGESSTTVQFQVNTEGTPPGTYIHSVFSSEFGQDAIITVESPGDDAEDGPEDGDGAEDGDAGDGDEATEEPEDGDAGDGAEDGDDADDGDEATEEPEDDDGAEDGDGAGDGDEATEEPEDGDGAEDGDDADDGDEATEEPEDGDADDGAEDGDAGDGDEATEEPEDGDADDGAEDSDQTEDGDQTEGNDEDGGEGTEDDSGEEQPATPDGG